MPNFYLGRSFDLSTGKSTGEDITYDPADLTTHAVVTGMTGSGKTGLCIALMEEAALEKIPAFIIDPKGDLTNLLLHFPDLAPADFQPWLDSELIRRQGKTLEQASAETAGQWKNGLAEWNITPERIRSLKEAVNFSVFTPGSDAGLRVSVLSSLEAPSVPWEGNREILREKISATVTALLGLVGFEDIDPVRSREHILLANIFEHAWSQGKSLDLTELILQTQTPPFDKLGAFPVETFFPAKDRLPLAMILNNILAAPTFESWREGQPLNIPTLLFSPDGKPRHNVFYVAHLSDAERMFFVTLLLSAIETWMRTQAGSSSLRALVYFDEIYGYLPPQRNPPSKQPLLRMLKQARAFGVGLLLATQNPVDVDYKALSNAGTWFVGKLQTERDKERLLDGLESITGGLDRAGYAQALSALGKRVFLMHNVHAGKPVIFQTRWAMNFLAGPLTRTQIPALNILAGAITPVTPATQTDTPEYVSFGLTDSIPGSPVPVSISVTDTQPTPHAARITATYLSVMPGSVTKPTVPAGVNEFFLPLSFSLTEAFTAAMEPLRQDAQLSAVLYRPVLLAVAKARLLDRRYSVDTEIASAVLVDSPDKRGAVKWDDFVYKGPSLERLDNVPAPQARFAAMDLPLTDAKLVAMMTRNFTNWVYRTVKVTVRENRALKITAPPEMTQSAFRTECANAARTGRDAELDKTFASLDKQIDTLKRRLKKEELELNSDQEVLNKRSWEEMNTVAENVFGVFRSGRTKRLTRAVEKGRLKSQAEANLEESKVTIAQLKEQIDALQQQHEQKSQEINARWGDLVDDVNEISITARKSDIFIEHFGVAWMPFYLVKAGDQTIDSPAFGGE